MIYRNTYIVLDNSSIIPCGYKPEEEKRAIRILGELLPKLNIVWITSRDQLKTLIRNFRRIFKEHHPLPRFQTIFNIRFPLYIGRYRIVDLKQILMKYKNIDAIDIELKLKIVDPFKNLDENTRDIIDNESRELDQEDRKFIALAIYTCQKIVKHNDTLYITLLDKKLENAILNTIAKINCSTNNINIFKPKELLEKLQSISSNKY